MAALLEPAVDPEPPAVRVVVLVTEAVLVVTEPDPPVGLETEADGPGLETVGLPLGPEEMREEPGTSTMLCVSRVRIARKKKCLREEH